MSGYACTAASTGGRALLGSLVQNVDDGPFTLDYPAPYSLSDIGLVLNQIKALGGPLGIPSPVNTDVLAGFSLSLNASSGLSLAGNGNVPGVPINLNLDVDYSETSSALLSFGPGSQLEYIPTDYLSRLSKYFGGDPKKAFPNVAVSIPNNRIVDVVVIGVNFAYEFTQKSSINASFAAQAAAATVTAGGKFAVTATGANSFKVALTDGVEYLVGLQTINWDNLDS